MKMVAAIKSGEGREGNCKYGQGLTVCVMIYGGHLFYGESKCTNRGHYIIARPGGLLQLSSH